MKLIHPKLEFEMLCFSYLKIFICSRNNKSKQKSNVFN